MHRLHILEIAKQPAHFPLGARQLLHAQEIERALAAVLSKGQNIGIQHNVQCLQVQSLGAQELLNDGFSLLMRHFLI